VGTIHVSRRNFAYPLAAKRAEAAPAVEVDLSCMRVFGAAPSRFNPTTMRAFVDKFAACG